MTAEASRPWLHWLNKWISDDAIRSAAYSPCLVIPNLCAMSAEEATTSLTSAWTNVFVPCDDHVALLSCLVDVSRSYARSLFPTLNAYNRLRSSPPVETPMAQTLICLTGLAGVSKTSLVSVLNRILQLEDGPTFSTPGQVLAIHPVRRATISGHPSIASILRSLANPMIGSYSSRQSLAFLRSHVSDWFGATATSMLTVDEMQFLTQSSQASTQTVQLIMTFASLGVPMVYVANYSLVNKLLLRPQEEKDRLLARPMVLNPPSIDNPAWSATIDELIKVSPGVFQLDGKRDCEKLHHYTAGLYRALRELLVAAYRDVRGQGRFEVGLFDVERAYRSRSYSARRADVEALASLSVSRLLETSRPDLVCPFPEWDPPKWRRPTSSQEASATAAKPSMPSIPEAIVESSLSASGQSALKRLQVEAQPTEKSTPRNKPSSSPPRTGKVTAEALLRGDQFLQQAESKARRTRSKASTGRHAHD